MLGLSPTTRVFLKTGITDLRLSYEGLYCLVEAVIKQDPLSGHLFVFCNRGRNRVKILYFDKTGLWCCAKRLEQSTFAWPKDGEAEIDPTELHALLNGFELKRRRGWYHRGVAA